MSYITPITDRAAADIIAQNSKAYFNVVDWTRIYNNAQLVNSLAAIMLGSGIVFDALSDPTTATIPSITNFNTLLANIERIRLAMAALIPALTEIKDDWVAGINRLVFNYTHVNQWESALDAIWQYWGGPALQACPTLSGDLTITTGNQTIIIDCLDAANFNIDLQGSANLYII